MRYVLPPRLKEPTVSADTASLPDAALLPAPPIHQQKAWCWPCVRRRVESQLSFTSASSYTWLKQRTYKTSGGSFRCRAEAYWPPTSQRNGKQRRGIRKDSSPSRLHW